MRKVRSVLGSNSKVILHTSSNTHQNIPSERPQRLQHRRKSYTTINQSLSTTNYKQLLSHSISTYHFPKSLISATAAIIRNTDGYFYTFLPRTLYSPLDFYSPFILPSFFSFFLISHSIQIIPSLFIHSMSSISVEVFVE